jgi:hypothetical protein
MTPAVLKPKDQARGPRERALKRALFIGLSLLAGGLVTVSFWPPWYDTAPIIPLTQRFARAAIAVASGTVVAGVALDLLAGFPLVRWFFTWTHNLAIKGRAKSPVAAWRELRAAEQASTRWRARRSERPVADEPSGDRDGGNPRAHTDVRAYADVKQEHRERGDEDPPEYGSSREAPGPRASLEVTPRGSGELLQIPVTPAVERLLRGFRRYARRTGLISSRLVLLRKMIQDSVRSGQLTLTESDALWNTVKVQVRGAAAGHALAKITKPRDGVLIGDEASEELWEQILGPDKPR